MAREHSFWDSLHKASREYEGLDLRRVENSLTQGTPDVEGCFFGRSFWIELKSADRPVRPTSALKFDLTIFQARWLQKRWHVGGHAWVLVRVGKGSNSKVYLIPGKSAGLIAETCTEGLLAELSVKFEYNNFQDLLWAVCLRPDFPNPSLQVFQSQIDEMSHAMAKTPKWWET